MYQTASADILTQWKEAIAKNQAFALLENLSDRRLPDEERALLFLEQTEQIIVRKPEELEEAFDLIERLCEQGLWLVGSIAFEAGYYFKGIQSSKQSNSVPLLHFVAFKQAYSLDEAALEAVLVAPSKEAEPALYNIKSSTEKLAYDQCIQRLHKEIYDGNVYQVNYTFNYKFNYFGTIQSFYTSLRSNQRASYAGWLQFSESTILSLSPELFVRKSGETLYTRPMKGTAARKSDNASDPADIQAVHALKNDIKNKAEHLMIVDLLRNDIGSIAQAGTVKVTDLFSIETYQTLHQMVSNVEGKIPKLPLYKIFKALFPSGSITGAPKISAMKLIDMLEDEPRGFYTGSIGFVKPNLDFTFNVAIRTIEITGASNEAKLGIGGGIVMDSNQDMEWDEANLKAEFLMRLNDAFKLIETMRYSPKSNSILRLEKHLERLKGAAECFSFPYSKQAIEKYLVSYTTQMQEESKIRLLLARKSGVTLTHEMIDDDKTSRKYICLSRQPSDDESIFRQFKTTRRFFYENIYASARKNGFYDVIITNNKNELLETTRHNIFLEKNRILYTPSYRKGFLLGVMRGELLEIDKHAPNIREEPVSLSDLEKADRIFLSNSVVGLIQVYYKGDSL